MISHQFRSGSTPAIILSVARLMLWTTVAAIRLTSRTLRRIAIYWIGFWIGYAAVTRDNLGRRVRIQTGDAGI